MMLTPGGAVLVGAIAAVLSVCGFRFDHDHTDDEDNDDDHEDWDMKTTTIGMKISHYR